MKKLLSLICLAAFFVSCNTSGQQKEVNRTDTVPNKTSADLPYTPSYSSNFSDDVSDADLKMVLMTYKDWESGNMKGLEDAMADSVVFVMSTGRVLNLSKADLMKLWKTTRDSLSSISIDMQAWHKMYSKDKNEGHIVTWYKETDRYKIGKVDSAYYHDINRLKNGKIVWYSQYKRPAM
jgi:ketosteroid isomerase-like protein